MPAVTVRHGFQVSVSTLVANSLGETEGIAPFYADHPEDYVSKFLSSKMGGAGDRNNYRVIILQRAGYNPVTAYITYF